MKRAPAIAAVCFGAACLAAGPADDEWRVGLDLFGAAFGPITYDRQSRNSTASGLDPQLASSGLRLGLENANVYGSLNVALLGRYYQPVENTVSAHYSGDIAAYTETTTITAQGFGLATHFVLWPPAKRRTFHPTGGLTVERDRLAVRTKSVDNSGAVIDAASEQSVLFAAYIDAGLRWRVLAQPFEADLTVSLLGPVYANAPGGVNNHRARTGVEAGMTFLFTPPHADKIPEKDAP